MYHKEAWKLLLCIITPCAERYWAQSSFHRYTCNFIHFVNEKEDASQALHRFTCTAKMKWWCPYFCTVGAYRSSSLNLQCTWNGVEQKKRCITASMFHFFKRYKSLFPSKIVHSYTYGSRNMEVYNGVKYAGGKILWKNHIYFFYLMNMQYTEGIASVKCNGVKGFCIFDAYLHTFHLLCTLYHFFTKHNPIPLLCKA